MVVLFIEIGRTGCEDSLVLAVTVHREKQVYQLDKSLGVIFLIYKVEIMPSI